jgi:hypothetical protein
MNMTVGQLIEALRQIREDAVVLMESGGGLSRVAELDFVEAQGLGAPAEVILLPSHDE